MPLNRLRDMNSVAHCEEGTEQAGLELVYAQYHVALLRLAWLLSGSREDAEDVVQNVFVRYSQVSTRPDKPGAYLRTMVVNAVHDLGRSRALSRRVDAPPDHVRASGDILELWDAVARLPRDQREVVVLRYHDDLSHEQIAEVLACPVGTVRSRLARGLTKLREVCHD